MNVQQMKCLDTKIAQLQGMFSVRTGQKFKFSPGVYLICSERCPTCPWMKPSDCSLERYLEEEVEMTDAGMMDCLF